MSAEIRERALEMILEGKLGGSEIARILEVVPRQIFKLAAKHAVRLPDKRNEKKGQQ
jgi:transposase-like protein